MLYGKIDDVGTAYQPPTIPAPAPAPSAPGPTASAPHYAAPAPAPSAPGPTASAPHYAPPPVAPSGSITLSQGFTPDYAALLQNDPAYLSARSAAELAQSNAATQRKAALREALIRYGGMPTGFTDQYGDIDQATQEAAAQNQNSVLARLANEYSQSQDQFRRSLASRGALQSGDLNYGQNQLDTAYGQQRYDAANSFGNDANQALNAYASVISGNAQNLTGAIQGAESNVYSNPAYRPTPAVTANYDASRSSAYGQPIYVDDSGNLFDQNGNPFAPPSGGSSGGGTAPFVPPGFSGFDANGNWIG